MPYSPFIREEELLFATALWLVWGGFGLAWLVARSGLVSFLCSPDARFVTGQTYVIDGGRSLAMKGSD